jgi:hypothetical protein
LAAQILLYEGFTDLDPSHPLGGRDGGKDATAKRGEYSFIMAVYFARGQQSLNEIKSKFLADLSGVKRNRTDAIAFVTNQELTLGAREELESLADGTTVELYHLERITTILDDPKMHKVREQFLDIQTDKPRKIHLGGQGGQAPGAGGGGGGAIGPDACGGNGGSGGNIYYLDGKDGEAPGAGGGGAGAVGTGAVAGEGGGGGDHIILSLGPDEIGPESGVHHLQFRVGQGGRNGPGEDTIINFCAKDGRVLRSVIAKGGKMGAPPYVRPVGRTPTKDDLNAGLKVTTIIAGEYIRIRDGFVTIVDGGWDIWTGNSNPFKMVLPLLVEVNTGTIALGTVLDLDLVVRSPDGFQVLKQPTQIAIPEALIRRTRFITTLEFSGSQSGLWSIEILAGEQVVGDFSIEVRLPG